MMRSQQRNEDRALVAGVGVTALGVIAAIVSVSITLMTGGQI